METAARLSTVSETLFLTLRARALETQRPEGLLADGEAVRLLQTLGNAVPERKLDWRTYAGIIVRTDILDREVGRYLTSARPPLVVNLGAGLCTRYERLGRPAIDWIEIDFPDVIALRRSLLPENALHRAIACSLTDRAWVDQVSRISAADPLFLAEGLLWYLSDAELKDLLITLSRHFPGGRLLTDVPSPFLSVLYRWHPRMRIPGIRLHGGTIGSQRQLDRWAGGIHLQDEWRQYDRGPELWGRFAYLQHIPGLRDWGKIVSLRFKDRESRG